MKKLKLAVILITVLIVLAGCYTYVPAYSSTTTTTTTSSTTSTASSSSAQNAAPSAVPDELDAAIRSASNELNRAVPRGSFIGIINIQSSSAALSEYIISELMANAVRDRNFTVLDRQRLDEIRAEQGFQLSGEVDDNFALSIGRFIGAQSIVTGTVTPLGNRFRITVQALDVQTATVQAQFNRNIDAGETITALMAVRNPPATAVAPARTAATAAPATQAPAPAATRVTPAPQAQSAAALTPGTYTFWPRIQAYQNGVAINVFIYQIVVRGRNMLVYIGDRERGPADSQYMSGGFGSNSVITNLDNISRSFKAVQETRSPDYAVGSRILSFENVTGSRFSLEGSNKAIFEEFILGQPD